MSGSRAQQAAANNASWCNAVCAAHGQPGRVDAGLWWHGGPVPRFYPNAVTLRAQPPQLMPRLRTMIDTRQGVGWSLKDSFACLDLGALQCRELFSAQWLWRAGIPVPSEPRAGLSWRRLRSADDLAAWERAWSADVPAPERVFLPPLLDDAATCVIAVERGENIVGGIIVHGAAGVAGLTNLFTCGEDDQATRDACLAAASACFPAVPLVTYEVDTDVALFKRLGFEPVGRLRVWLHDPA